MSEFKIGDIVIIVVTHPNYACFNGLGCEIMSSLDSNGKYEVRIDGRTPKKGFSGFAAKPWSLRKKKPPLSNWEDVETKTGWNPVKETTFINE